MTAHPNYLRVALLSALTAGVCLVGTLVVPFSIALIVGASVASASDPPPGFVAAMIALALTTLAGGSAAWGIALARLATYPRPRQLALACALSYVPATLAVAFLLGRIEPIVVEGAPGVPIHVLFTWLFVPAVFLVAAATGAALGIAVRSQRIAARTAIGGGVAAALAFLAVDLLLDSLGMRVGGPGAAERATMLTVLAIGDLGAAMAGGAVVGVILARYTRLESGAAETAPALQAEGPR